MVVSEVEDTMPRDHFARLDATYAVRLKVTSTDNDKDLKGYQRLPPLSISAGGLLVPQKT